MNNNNIDKIIIKDENELYKINLVLDLIIIQFILGYFYIKNI